MFTVYNNGNVGFRSTADNLYELKNIDELSPARLKPDEGFIQQFNNKKDQGEKKSSENAISEYKKMANIDTLEPVYEVKDIMTRNCIYIDNESIISCGNIYLKINKIKNFMFCLFIKICIC